jgi:hypothetical protein
VEEAGRGVGGRGAGCRRTWRSPAGGAGRRRQGHCRERRWEGEVGALAGGGDDVRHSKKWCSLAGEAWGGGGRGAMSGSARLGGAGWDARGQESRGRLGSARSDGWHGVGWVAWAERARAGFILSGPVMDLWSITLHDK